MLLAKRYGLSCPKSQGSKCERGKTSTENERRCRGIQRSSDRFIGEPELQKSLTTSFFILPYEEKLLMNIPCFSPRLIRLLVALAAVLAIVGSALFPPATTYAASVAGTHKFDPLSAWMVRPLWKYAQKVSASGGIPPCLTSTTPPLCYSPQQIRTAYNIQPLLKAGITGKGRTVVLIDGATSTTLTSDVHLYDQLYGLKDPKINVFSPFGPPSVNPGVYVETALDIE